MILRDATTIISSLRILRELRAHLRWDAERMRAYQLARVQRLVRFAYDNVPLYRRLYEQADVHPAEIRCLDDFARLPTVDKQTFRTADPGDAISRPFRHRKLVHGTTSGSTGEPLRFVLDGRAVAYKIAVNLRSMELTGYRPGRDRLLQVSPSARLVGRWTQRIGDRLLKRRFLTPFESDYSSALEQLRRFRPTAVFGYTSYLRSLAEHVLRYNESLPLRLVMTTSETLQTPDRELISQAFGVPIYDQYGSTEFGRVATEYPGGRGMLVQADVTYVEVEPFRSELQDAAAGQLVLTSLVNCAMPFIRYRIGDAGRLAAEPSVRFPAFPELQALDGRIHDMLVRGDGVRVVPEFVHRVLRGYEEIDRYQVIQRFHGLVEIRLRLRRPLGSPQVERMQREFQQFLGAVRVTVRVTDEFVARAGKSPPVMGYPAVGIDAGIDVAAAPVIG
jgi:phenylacetate-CoA ligase